MLKMPDIAGMIKQPDRFVAYDAIAAGAEEMFHRIVGAGFHVKMCIRDRAGGLFALGVIGSVVCGGCLVIVARLGGAVVGALGKGAGLR